MPARPVLFGEVLFDHFPDGRQVLGGAPFNVAWHLEAFGLDPLLISRVGRDRPGERIRQAMADWGLDLRGIQVDDRYPTGEVRVTLDAGEPRFEILPERAWDFLDAEALPPLPAEAGLLYTGSLIRRAPDSARALEALQAATDLPLFLDVNLRTPWWSQATVDAALGAARWLKLNEDELRRLRPNERPLAERAEALLAETGAEAVLITRGARGCVAHLPGHRPLRAVPDIGTPLIDTVGAGDAFAAVMITGLLRGWPLDRTLGRAQRFASAIVGQRGAIVDDRDFYAPFLQEWELPRPRVA